MEIAIIFLILYTSSLTILLYGFGSTYDIQDLIEIEIPTAPAESDVVGQVIYGFQLGFNMMMTVFQIPLTAFTVLTLIAADVPIIAVFILMPAVFCMLVIISGIVKTIRGVNQ